MIQSGYAGKILKLDLSSGTSEEICTSDYAERFIGGRGISAGLYWDLASFQAGAFDPGNCLIIATGPVTGFSGLAGCRWTICSRSPISSPEFFSYGNLGGKWGTALKSAGYDALVIQGKAEKPVYLFIHDDSLEIRDAAGLWGKSSFDAADLIRRESGINLSILTIGPAAENRVVFATAVTDECASISGGLGAVIGAKNIKAIAVAGQEKPRAAEPEKLRDLIQRIRILKSRTYDGPSPWAVPGVTRRDICHGCGLGCSRQYYSDEKGRRYKFFCQATGVYAEPVKKYYGHWNEVRLKAVQFCDGYGLDTGVMAPMILWLIDCFNENILSENDTGLPFSRAGSLEFIENLARKIALREGFGDLLARGTLQAANEIGPGAVEIACKYVGTRTNENKNYDPRMISTTALLYATEPRMPIQQLHAVSGNTLINWVNWVRRIPGAFLSTTDLIRIAEKFWGGEKAVDFSTTDGKALAAKMAQDRVYVQESMILCDLHWPAMMTSADNEDHTGDPTLESQIFSAITGKEVDEQELLTYGERIFNLQRAILLRQGWKGRENDQILEYLFQEPLKQGEIFFNPDGIMPGPGGKLISKLGSVLNRGDFEHMKDEYYLLRGWDKNTGLPSANRLMELGLGDIIDELKKENLVR